ncbi:MAG TPA: pitrilysin family protein [Patescibacteria group bacterium]|nr:pitrilysin family protein [Patescibacteria group bacterium]
MYQHQLTTLKNGLRLITIPMPQLESVTVMVGVGAGSRYETKAVNGLFHFIEHMAFKGTKKKPSTFDISSELDAIGSGFNAFTDKELTGYYIKLATRHQELAFDILSDMMLNSLFKTEEIEREKQVIIEEINMYGDTPIRQVQEYFDRLLYGDNPMGWSTAGEKKSVKQIKRGDFISFLNQLYFAQNMNLVIAGKFDQGETEKLASRYFEKLKKTGKKDTKEIKIEQKKPRLKVYFKKTDQAHFCLGVPGYQYSHPDRFILAVLSTILGGSMSSRLWIQIRERRGLAYYVGSEPDFYTDSGYLLAREGVRLKSVDEAIKVTLDEFWKLKETPVSFKELKKAKEFLKGKMVLALEDSFNVASRYAAQLLLEKKIRTPEETMRLIDKVTVADVQRVAKAIFKPEKLNLALIGPYKDEDRFKKLLGGKG